MKSKLTKKPDPELEQDDEESAEVDSGGPGIAAAKKSKMAIIAASSILITVVLYVLFFKSEPPQTQEKLEEVKTPTSVVVAGSEDGKSPFEFDKKEEVKDESVELFNKPATPEIPTLPELPKEVVPLEQIPLAPEVPAVPAVEQKPQIPVEPTPAPAVAPQAQTSVAPVVQEQNQQPVPSNVPDPRYAPILVVSDSSGGVATPGVGYDNNIVNLNKDPIAALQKTPPAISATYIDDRSHTIAQGKLLTAVLETAINTEVPGFVRAVVSRDVYGESGTEILIPRGSRLFGSYSSRITRGQGRVEIAWTRLIRTDGVDLAISFNASDQFGRSGISGDVDNKYGTVIANSLLTSVLAVAGVIAAEKLSKDESATTTTVNPTLGTTTTSARASNQAIYDVSRTIMDTVGQMVTNTLNTNPVIRVPQGTRITIVVNADINIPALNKK